MSALHYKAESLAYAIQRAPINICCRSSDINAKRFILCHVVSEQAIVIRYSRWRAFDGEVFGMPCFKLGDMAQSQVRCGL